ncbi:haloacid dehalogenase superfamily enzyme subfamily IA [Clostridium sp. CAG:451]|nr:haloacid dehalogenase superfamily enzyme subfamily IA [Clostridium sp. CAG:451]
MKKFIWDLDGTLLSGDFSTHEISYFKEKLMGQDIETFLKNKYSYLMEYERTFLRYDTKLLSDFLSLRSGLVIDETVIMGWNEHSKSVPDTIHTGAEEVLSYLQSKGYENILYTNWFKDVQEARLRNANLLEYFSEIYGGELAIKPNAIGYKKIIKDVNPNEVVMIGDNIVNDVLVPRSIGITTYHYDPLEKSKDKNKIKTLKKIKEMY